MINLNDYKMTALDGAGVYCGTYKKYNEGSLFGMWINLEACSDADEFFEVCRELHKDESDPEFMFQDYQGFPPEFYSESMNSDDVEKILNYLELDDDTREMLDAYCEIHGYDVTDFDDFVETAKDRCCGQYDSFKDFAYQMADEEIACHSNGAATEFFERYFDYEAYARDLKMDYYISDNGYIFRSY